MTAVPIDDEARAELMRVMQYATGVADGYVAPYGKQTIGQLTVALDARCTAAEAARDEARKACLDAANALEPSVTQAARMRTALERIADNAGVVHYGTLRVWATVALAACERINDPATHRCRICGALWWRGHVHPVGESWSLRSPTCGKCCDNVPMGDQIEPLPSATPEDNGACRSCGAAPGTRHGEAGPELTTRSDRSAG